MIYIPKYEPGRLGGGWTWSRNFVKGIGDQFTSDYNAADTYLLPSASMVSTGEVEQAKADGKKIVMRVDNITRNSRNKRNGMDRMFTKAQMADLVNIKYTIKGGSVDRKSISLAEMPTVAASAVSTSRSTPIIDSVLQKDVDTLVDDLDGWVGPNNIKSIDSIS